MNIAMNKMDSDFDRRFGKSVLGYLATTISATAAIGYGLALYKQVDVDSVAAAVFFWVATAILMLGVFALYWRERL